MGEDTPDQFHFDPDTYLDMMAAEVPGYEGLQRATAEATSKIAAVDILELGIGTGETSLRVLALHPGARLTGVDESEAMLERARERFPLADLRVGRLEDPLPGGTYDLVVSALAVHHLEPAAKAELFGRVAGRLRSGGRFVLADLVVPDDPAEALTPIDDDGYDKPDSAADQLAWMGEAGLSARLYWSENDLAVLVGDMP